VIANVRLDSFNGIYLAYLAKLARPDARVLIYSDRNEPVLGREAQSAGAFYERRAFITAGLARFLDASLPAADRREAGTIDRRTAFRGGRRASDVATVRGADSPAPA